MFNPLPVIVFYHQWKLSRKLRDLCFQIFGSLRPSGKNVCRLASPPRFIHAFFARLQSNMAREEDFKSKRLNSVPLFLLFVRFTDR